MGNRATWRSLTFAIAMTGFASYLLYGQVLGVVQAHQQLSLLEARVALATKHSLALQTKRDGLVLQEGNHVKAQTAIQAQSVAHLRSALHSPWPTWLALVEGQLPQDVALMNLSLNRQAQTVNVKVEAKSSESLYRMTDALAHHRLVGAVRPIAQGINDQHPMKPVQLQFEILFKAPIAP